LTPRHAASIAFTTISTAVTFYLATGIGLWFRRGNLPEAAIAGIVGGCANVGYMGPGILARLHQS
jgi:hypothetical protein